MAKPGGLSAGLLVVNTGALMTVQDLGRPGLAHLGVTRSGAADIPAHTHANALVGNTPSVATLEITAGGCEVQAREDVLLAVTGTRVPLWVGSVPAPFGSPIRVGAGQTLTFGTPDQGLRNYLAVRGGIDVPPVLGSRATDILSGLGPSPVTANTALPIGVADPIDQAGFDALRQLAIPPTQAAAQDDHPARASAILKVRVRLGPRDDWFTQAAIDTFLGSPYELSTESNRVGARLTGPVVERARDGELESEGLVLGAVQVPASGQPVIFLADHPTVGGYPVIAVVEPDDLPVVAQARPGDWLEFVAIDRQPT